jgi:hypothetical protein
LQHHTGQQGEDSDDEDMYVKAEYSDTEKQCNQCDSTYCICNLSNNSNQDDDTVSSSVGLARPHKLNKRERKAIATAKALAETGGSKRRRKYTAAACNNTQHCAVCCLGYVAVVTGTAHQQHVLYLYLHWQ